MLYHTGDNGSSVCLFVVVLANILTERAASADSNEKETQ